MAWHTGIGTVWHGTAYGHARRRVQDVESEASFAEVDDAAEPGSLSERAHKVGNAIQKVKELFRTRKDKGGNVSPSPAAPPKAHKKRNAVKKAVKKVLGKVVGKVVRKLSGDKKKPAPAKRNAALKSLGAKKKRPIIAVKAKAPKKPARRPAPRPRPAGRKPQRRPIRVPRAPPAARGPVDDLFHSERIIPEGSENRDPEMAKLNLALEAVKEDILSTNKQINDERRWVIAVGKIIKSYNTKACARAPASHPLRCVLCRRLTDGMGCDVMWE